MSKDEYKKKSALDSVKHPHGSNLKNLNDRFKNDKDIVKTALASGGEYFLYASDTLRDDEEFILDLINSKSNLMLKTSVIECVSDNIKNNKKVMLKAVGRNSNAYRYVSDSLKHDYEMTTAMIYGFYSKWPPFYLIPEAIKKDKKFILYFLEDYTNKNRTDLDYSIFGEIEHEVVSDLELMMNAINVLGPEVIKYIQMPEENIDNDLRERFDKVILKHIKKDGSVLKYLSKGFKNNKELVLQAISIGTPTLHNPILQYVSEELKDDKETVVAAIKANSKSLEFASKRLKADKNIVLESVKDDGYNLEYAGEALKDDWDVVLEATQATDYNAFVYASTRLQNDRSMQIEIFKKISAYDGGSDQTEDTLSEPIGKYKWYALEVIKKYGDRLKWSFGDKVCEELRNDQDIMVAAVGVDPWYLLHGSEDIQNNFLIVSKAVLKDKEVASFASYALKKKYFRFALEDNEEAQYDTINSEDLLEDFYEMIKEKITNNIEITNVEIETVIENKKKDVLLALVNYKLIDSNNKINIALALEDRDYILKYTKDNPQYLANALRFADTQLIDLLIDNLTDIKYLDNNGNNLLEISIIYKNDIKYSEYFLNQGIKSNTILEQIVKNNDLKLIKLFEEHDLKVDLNLLNTAFDYNSVDIIEYLIKQGIQTSTDDLAKALKLNNETIIKSLIYRGFELEYHDSDDNNLLEISINEKNDITFIKYFLDKGLKSDKAIFRSIYRDDIELLNVLNEYKFNINIKNPRGESLLDIAILEESERTAQRLIELNIETTIYTLINALKTKNMHFIDLFLDKHFDKYFLDSSNNNLLDIAIKYENSPDCINDLLSKGLTSSMYDTYIKKEEKIATSKTSSRNLPIYYKIIIFILLFFVFYNTIDILDIFQPTSRMERGTNNSVEMKDVFSIFISSIFLTVLAYKFSVQVIIGRINIR